MRTKERILKDIDINQIDAQPDVIFCLLHSQNWYEAIIYHHHRRQEAKTFKNFNAFLNLLQLTVETTLQCIKNLAEFLITSLLGLIIHYIFIIFIICIPSMIITSSIMFFLVQLLPVLNTVADIIELVIFALSIIMVQSMFYFLLDTFGLYDFFYTSINQFSLWADAYFSSFINNSEKLFHQWLDLASKTWYSLFQKSETPDASLYNRCLDSIDRLLIMIDSPSAQQKAGLLQQIWALISQEENPTDEGQLRGYLNQKYEITHLGKTYEVSFNEIAKTKRSRDDGFDLEEPKQFYRFFADLKSTTTEQWLDTVANTI